MATKSAGRLVKLAAVALGVVIVLGGAAGAWLALGGSLGRTAYYTDADTIRAPARQVAPRDILWQPPQKLPEDIINSAADEYEPRLSWDG